MQCPWRINSNYNWCFTPAHTYTNTHTCMCGHTHTLTHTYLIEFRVEGLFYYCCFVFGFLVSVWLEVPDTRIWKREQFGFKQPESESSEHPATPQCLRWDGLRNHRWDWWSLIFPHRVSLNSQGIFRQLEEAWQNLYSHLLSTHTAQGWYAPTRSQTQQSIGEN